MKNNYYVVDETVYIYLKNACDFAIIDLIDLKLVDSIVGTWTGCYNKDTNLHYVTTSVNLDGKKTTIYLHSFIMNIEDFNSQVDHKNHDGLLNTRSNLNIVTNRQNQQNRRINKNNKSGYRGVSWSKTSNQWIALIRINYKQIRLGSFDSPEIASIAYENARKEYYEYGYKIDKEKVSIDNQIVLSKDEINNIYNLLKTLNYSLDISEIENNTLFSLFSKTMDYLISCGVSKKRLYQYMKLYKNHSSNPISPDKS